jgi:hypothetical protein
MPGIPIVSPGLVLIGLGLLAGVLSIPLLLLTVRSITRFAATFPRQDP